MCNIFSCLIVDEDSEGSTGGEPETEGVRRQNNSENHREEPVVTGSLTKQRHIEKIC